MITDEAPARHCIVWFGEPSSTERDSLAGAGWSIRSADASAGGGICVRAGDFVVAMADLRHRNADALQAMGQLMASHPQLPWLALVSSETAAQAPEVKRILQASVDFFTAPIDTGRMINTLALISGARPRVMATDMAGIIGRSPAMRAAMASLRKYAPVDLPVLITGETGTGKECAANALHRLSSRAGRPFVAINCGALPPDLVQSELFGHERCAFTGATSRRIGHIESAAGGTVFLDEIGDLPLDAQTSLLRFMQEGTIERVGGSRLIHADVRVLAATHVDLEKAVCAGHFREDLYYRLNVLRLSMPPLRERDGDTELLAQHFLDEFREQHGSRARGFNTAAIQAMRQFSWPGNVRELINRVQRAAVVAETSQIDVADIDMKPAVVAVGARPGLDNARSKAERDAVITCLRASRYNISECARRLQVSRVTVYRLCKKHQVELEEIR